MMLGLSLFLGGALLPPFVQAGTESISPSRIEPEARALAEETASVLREAKTIRLTARHKMDPRLGVGAQFEKGPMEIIVKRPHHFYAIQRAGNETREIAYDGWHLCLLYPELRHHALEPLRADSIDQFADKVDERFGFRPPVAELLSGRMANQIFRHVTTAKVMGDELVGWTRCQRLRFEQEGMTGDLWIARKDRLPRRYRLTFTLIEGHPTWDIHLQKWELNAPVDEALFSKRPADESHRAPLLKSR